jgi:hypothetical protein
MESAEMLARVDYSVALDRAVDRRIFGQREVSACPIVILSIAFQRPAKMRFAEYDGVVCAFAPDRADNALDIAVVPSENLIRLERR